LLPVLDRLHAGGTPPGQPELTSPLKVRAPVGVVQVPDPVSRTVAVQSVWWPDTVNAGEQLTATEVARLDTPTDACMVFWPCTPSEACVAEISVWPDPTAVGV
jgi:hypothetical protein